MTKSKFLSFDSTPPVIEHTSEENANSGESKLIEAVVSDNDAIASVQLLYRPKVGEIPFSAVEMNLDGSSLYSGEIPKSQITSHGVRYCIKAIDEAGNATQTPFADIIVEDAIGPEMTGEISIRREAGGFLISWPPPEDADLEGYRLYIGPSSTGLQLHEDLRLSNSVFLDESFEKLICKVSAYDTSGLEGASTNAFAVQSCLPCDADCDEFVGLNDIEQILNILCDLPHSAIFPKQADSNGDNRIDLKEATDIMRNLPSEN